MDQISKNKILNQVFFFLLFACNISLIWIFDYLPTQDGPCHLYNLTILKDLLNGGKIWGEFFTYNLRLTPNLGFTLFSYPLLTFFPPLVVEKIFFSFFISLTVFTSLYFLKTFETPIFPNSFFIFPILFNFNVLMGFYSYIISVPIFLLSFSLVFRFRKMPAVLFFIFFNILGIFTFFIHLISFCFFVLSFFILKFCEINKNFISITKLFIYLILISLPSLFLVLSYLSISVTDFQGFSYLLNIQRYLDLYRNLFTFSTAVFFPWQILPSVFLGSIIIFFLYSSLKENFSCFRSMPLSKKTIFILFISMFLIYFLAPFRFGEGSFFNQRFPWVILLILQPLLKFTDKKILKISTSLLPVLISMMFLFTNFFFFYQKNLLLQNYLSGLEMNFPSSTLILPYKKKHPEDSAVDFLLHASTYYGFLNKIFVVSNYQAESDFFLVKFIPNISSDIPSQEKIAYFPHKIEWSKYPKIEFLLCWKLESEDIKKIRFFYEKIFGEKDFSIWRRI